MFCTKNAADSAAYMRMHLPRPCTVQANESKSQRGMLRLRADARAAEAADAKTVPQAV